MGAPSSTLPRYFSAAFAADTLTVHGAQGERGLSSPGVSYRTIRLQVRLSSSAEPFTVQSLHMRADGAVADFTFWDAEAAPSLGGAAGCSRGLGPVGTVYEGVDYDWIASSEDFVWLGNETISTQFATNVTAAHWASAFSCRDVWFVPIGGNNLVGPILYSVGDQPCTGPRREYEYSAFSELSFEGGAQQSSPLWSLPSLCYNSSGTAVQPSGGAGGLVAVVWVAVGCLLSALFGSVVTMLWMYRLRRPRERGTLDKGLSLNFDMGYMDLN
jgi:hypothetical protein